jgi:hypothetical protein
VHEPQGFLAIGEWIFNHLWPSLFLLAQNGTRVCYERIGSVYRTKMKLADRFPLNSMLQALFPFS